jgi:hypothetical protein
MRRAAERPDRTGRQKDLHREAFTGSRPREWIDSNMDYEALYRQVMDETPIGVNITAPWHRRGKGVSIPFMPLAASKKVRDFFRSGPLGEAVNAYRMWVVSRYGPNPVVRVGAIASDDVTRMQSARSAKFIRDETRKAGLTKDELILASHWLEGTARGPVPDKVRRYAEKMAQFTERNADEFVQAGGVLRRFGEKGKLEGGLDRQYVYHLLPRDEWDDFAVSALARRRMLYGKMPGFTKRREVLTIAELKKAGFHPVERLDELTFARAMAHHRAMSDMELSRSVARRFGRKADEAPDTWQRVPSQFVDADVVVPPDVARTLRSVIEARMAFPRNKAARGLQQANQRWKEWALFTLGHDIRNQFGDSALVFQATANPVAPFLSLYYGA